jgi:UDP-N-acetylmuramoylalanine--D-glutamate ligase
MQITETDNAMKAVLKDFKNKNITVVGLARSGIGAANLLSSLGANVSVTDIRSSDSLKEAIERLIPSIACETGGHTRRTFENADLIVVSPGIALDNPFLLQAQSRGVPVIGELELAYRIMTGGELMVPPKFIGVTGTNGKSTTSTLISLMLRQSGFQTLFGGNIGEALTGELYRLQAEGRVSGLDYVVAETSSFQLESIHDFNPYISLVLNISPDHLDRYKGLNDYIDAKARIFENQGTDHYLILNADDPLVMKMKEDKFAGRDAVTPAILYFSREREVEGICCTDSSLHFHLHSTPKTAPSAFLRKQEDGAVFPPLTLMDRNEIQIAGVHNLENAMAASLAALLAGCNPDSIRETLRHFAGLEHRLEFVREINGVRFINDSKGTNVGATMKSLESFRRVVLIMGGRDKGGDFTVLKDLIEEKVSTLVLMGEAREKIAHETVAGNKTVFAENLQHAVRESMVRASAGDTVLLSPGCASFDMFADFEERGRAFKEAVWKYKK